MVVLGNQCICSLLYCISPTPYGRTSARPFRAPAPVCLDLCLLIDLAARAGRYGIQRFLSFFLKSPMHDYRVGEQPVNHLYQQYTMLKNAIREMGGYAADETLD